MSLLVRIVGFLVCAICYSNCSSEEAGNPVSVGERNVWKNDCMRAPEPVIVDSPDQFADAKLPEGTFLIVVTKDNFSTCYNGDTIVCSTLNALESLIGLHGAEKLNGHVALQANVVGMSSEINSVVDLLKRKKIIRFSLVTDLDK